MPQYYSLVVDDNELHWWFDHIHSKCTVDDSWLICLSARSKKLTEEERRQYEIGRGEMMRTRISTMSHGEWNYDIWKQNVYSYNADKNSLLTKNGLPYPEKCLVVYDYLNPSSESKVLADQSAYTAKITAELIAACLKFLQNGAIEGIKVQLEKLVHSASHQKSCHAQNISRRNFIQFDYDLAENEDREAVYAVLHEKAADRFGRGNFYIVGTSGGFHVAVDLKCLKDDPNKYVKEVQAVMPNAKEFKKCEEGFLPCPGTLQYGKLVTVLNKEDFN